MDSDFLFITELSPSQSWLDSITLGPEGTIELKRFSRELKCYAAIGRPVVKEISPQYVLKEKIGEGNLTGQLREMSFFQMATNCAIVPQKECIVQDGRLTVTLHSYHPEKGDSMVIDIQPRQISHLKDKVTLGFGFVKLAQAAKTIEFEEYEYSLMGTFVMGASKFYWTFQQVRSLIMPHSYNDLLATIARPTTTHTFAHFALTVKVSTKLGIIVLDTKQIQAVSVDYPLC